VFLNRCKKATGLTGGLPGDSDKVNYFLQFLQVQWSPQLQLLQVQPWLSHFCLSFRAVWLTADADFINFVLII
jgi:hypothetical protein